MPDLAIDVLDWLVCGIAAFLIVQSKGFTNLSYWFVVGVTLGPIGVLLALLQKPEQ